jgi:multidrug efflux pump subunit AcrA (membrane-fusion protein)
LFSGQVAMPVEIRQPAALAPSPADLATQADARRAAATAQAAVLAEQAELRKLSLACLRGQIDLPVRIVAPKGPLTELADTAENPGSGNNTRV